MTEPTYQVVLEGRIQEGQLLSVVNQRLAALFKVDENRTAQLLETAAVIKRGLTAAAAEHYRSAIEQTGALCRIEPEVIEASALNATLRLTLVEREEEAKVTPEPSSPIPRQELPTPQTAAPAPKPAQCPKCGYQAKSAADTLISQGECPACGLILAKYLERQQELQVTQQADKEQRRRLQKLPVAPLKIRLLASLHTYFSMLFILSPMLPIFVLAMIIVFRSSFSSADITALEKDIKVVQSGLRIAETLSVRESSIGETLRVAWLKGLERYGQTGMNSENLQRLLSSYGRSPADQLKIQEEMQRILSITRLMEARESFERLSQAGRKISLFGLGFGLFSIGVAAYIFIYVVRQKEGLTSGQEWANLLVINGIGQTHHRLSVYLRRLLAAFCQTVALISLAGWISSLSGSYEAHLIYSMIMVLLFFPVMVLVVPLLGLVNGHLIAIVGLIGWLGLVFPLLNRKGRGLADWFSGTYQVQESSTKVLGDLYWVIMKYLLVIAAVIGLTWLILIWTLSGSTRKSFSEWMLGDASSPQKVQQEQPLTTPAPASEMASKFKDFLLGAPIDTSKGSGKSARQDR